MIKINRWIMMAIIMLVIIVPSLVCATILEVCQDDCFYEKIQAAIDAAVDGDTILVNDGTYVENISFDGNKSIMVQSQNGPVYTKINGAQNGSAVTFHSGTGKNSVLIGFTVSGGNGTLKADNKRHGGGIYCVDSSPKINKCIISGNGADGYGAGIYCEGINNAPNMELVNCTITGNVSVMGGGGIYCASSSLVITNCTISANMSKISHGGGMFCQDFPTITATNSIFWNNTWLSMPSEIYVSGDETPVLSISYSDIDYGYIYGSGYTLIFAENNINADPLFIDPITVSDDPIIGGDYHLQDYSPCVNSGTAVGAPQQDIDGNTRAIGTAYDIGSDEVICPDEDGDGFPGIESESCQNIDCNDLDENIYPGADEICDGIDNDCNDIDDDGADLLCNDNDFCTIDICNGELGCTNEIKEEICDDGIDNDCNGMIDESCNRPKFYADINLNSDPIKICFSADQLLISDPDVYKLKGNGSIDSLTLFEYPCSDLPVYCLYYNNEKDGEKVKIKIEESDPIIPGDSGYGYAEFYINAEHEHVVSFCIYKEKPGYGFLQSEDCEETNRVEIFIEAGDFNYLNDNCNIFFIAETDKTAFFVPEGINIISVYEISPSVGVEMNSGHTIEIEMYFELIDGSTRSDYDNGIKILSILYYDDLGAWKLDGITFNYTTDVQWKNNVMGMASFQTSHFSAFAVTSQIVPEIENVDDIETEATTDSGSCSLITGQQKNIGTIGANLLILFLLPFIARRK